MCAPAAGSVCWQHQCANTSTITCTLTHGVGAATAEFHLGVKGDGAYAQIGPLLQIPDTGETEVGVSGKAGYGFGPGYTELSFTNMDSDTTFNLKVGGKFQL